MPLTPPLPAPLPLWAKVLIQAAPFAWAVGEAFAEYVTSPDTEDELEWRYAVLTFTRTTPTGTTEDKAQVGFNIINITGGDLDSSWTSGDYSTCETQILSWWATVKTYVTDDYTLSHIKWYTKKHKAVMDATHRFEKSGPPVRVTVVGVAGTALNQRLPDQVAMSVTLKTHVPRHWGRIYLPGFAYNAIAATYGRWDTAYTTAVANATAELLDDLQDNDFFVVVPVTQVDGSLAKGVLGVYEVQVDDIPDVIRRRRARTPLSRVIGVPT